MKNLSLNSLCLTELNDSECLNIDGGSRSWLTIAAGVGVSAILGPLGALGFEAGYQFNS
ncbi:hypothetical protein G6M26_42205 [Agrobacterium tumefaciens]|nr:hypothetical protein [Agrobacterium tumefaciens]NTE25160.1 hypothetical protein [Agrobacterium tumefaciens]